MPAMPAGLPCCPRIGGGGGPDFAAGRAPPGAAAGAAAAGAGAPAGLAGSTAEAGWGTGRGGGFGDSLTNEIPRSDQYATSAVSARLEHYKEISDEF